MALERVLVRACAERRGRVWSLSFLLVVGVAVGGAILGYGATRVAGPLGVSEERLDSAAARSSSARSEALPSTRASPSPMVDHPSPLETALGLKDRLARVFPRREHIRIALYNNLRGEMTPCQCYRPMLGGLDRAVALWPSLSEGLAGDNSRTVLLATGDAFDAVPGAGAAAFQTKQWSERTRIVAQAFRRGGVLAYAPGPGSLGIAGGAASLLADDTAKPLLISNAPASLSAAASPKIHKGVGLGRFAVLAIAWHPTSTAPEIRDPWPSLAQALAGLESDCVRIVVLTTRGARSDEIVKAVKEAAGVDLWILSSEASEQVGLPSPTQSDGPPIVHVKSMKGQYVDWIDLYVDPGTRRVAAADSLVLFHEVARRSARTSSAGSATVPDSDLQRWFVSRAEALGEHANLAVHFRTEVHEGLDRDAVTRTAIEEYGAWLLREFLPSDRVSWLAEARVAARPYVGSETCGSCHEVQRAAWAKSRHGNAMATLENVKRQYDYTCFPCHSTGYRRDPLVTDIAALRILSDVGCESCHGPGGSHVNAPSRSSIAKPDASTCASCHDSAHSPTFSYEDKLPHVECIQARGVPRPR